MALKKEVEDAAFFAFRKTQADLSDTGRIDCIHVSDLIKECQRMPVLSKLIPIKSATTKATQRFYLGNLVHAKSYMSNIHMHEVPLLYNWLTDEGVDGDTFHGIHESTKWDYIAGAIDDVMKMGEDYIIVDKKTTDKIENKVRYGPSDENKLQLNIYRVLLKKCYGIDAKWGCNVFVDINPSSERGIVHPVAFKLRPMDETTDFIVQTAEAFKDHVVNKDIPPVHRCYLCDGMCEYATYCFGKQ